MVRIVGLSQSVGGALLGACSLLLGCADAPSPSSRWEVASGERASEAAAARPLGMHQPYASLGMTTEKRDPAGRPVRVGCAVCHTEVVAPADDNAERRQLEGFHRGIRLDHGDHSSCAACHNPPRYVDFRLAGGKVVTYGNVVELCGQCHSEQWRDYQHGAHGGMTGYWDEASGARHRNHCIDCHNPHAPAAARMQPAPRARVRFQRPRGGGHE